MEALSILESEGKGETPPLDRNTAGEGGRGGPGPLPSLSSTWLSDFFFFFINLTRGGEQSARGQSSRQRPTQPSLSRSPAWGSVLGPWVTTEPKAAASPMSHPGAQARPRTLIFNQSNGYHVYCFPCNLQLM